MIHLICVWLLALAFLGAGLFNLIGTAATRSGFVRWGYPGWWHLPTGALEVICAGLIAVPASRVAGMALAAVIIAAAVVTVLRHREFSHLAPLGVFTALLVLAAALG